MLGTRFNILRAAALVLASGSALLSAGIPAMAAAPKHLFLVMMENHSTEDILGNTADAPYINGLVKQPGVSYSTQYFGVTHPSLPNYLALFSGSTQGIFDDCKAGADVTCKPEEFVPDSGDPATAGRLLTDKQAATAAHQPHLFTGRTLVDQLETAGHSWKAYMEAMPADNKTLEYAPVGADGKVIAKLYAVKHNPFVYFAGVRNNPKRMAKVVPYEELAQDLSANNVPDFVWISPHQCHDMHGVSPEGATAVKMPDCAYPNSGLDHGAIKLGDAYLAELVPTITGSAAWKEGAVLIIVWDEDDYAGFAGTNGSPVGFNNTVLGGSRAPLIIVTAGQVPARKLIEPANHYNLLAAIESAWHLGCMNNSCKVQKLNTLAGLIE
jgi:phosphatidylinositol-3-phosphatase